MVICLLLMRESPRFSRATAVVLLAFMPPALLTSPAAAAPQPSGAPEQRDGADAKTLFSRGAELFAQKRFAEALDVLEQSYRLLPSPNTNLLIARCLRDLGRLVEALEHFQATETEARARVAAGESKKFRDTAEAAATEGSEVREKLGTIHIRVTHPPAASVVEVDGKPTALPADGALDVLHATGQTVIVVRPPSGAPQMRTVQVVAGGESSVSLEFSAAAPPPDSSLVKDTGNEAGMVKDIEAPPPKRAWTAPAALVSGGIGLLGFGFFAGFGAHSQAIYGRLKSTCAPRCGDRSDEIDQGAREQTIANASLVVGIAGAAATAVFTVLTLSASPRESKPRPKGTIELNLGLSSATVRGSF
jgi:hypothetical protein